MQAVPNFPAADGDVARAREAVLEAGRIAMCFFRKKHERWEKGPGQIVTEADIAIDRYLATALRAGNEGDGWLSEETEDDPTRLGRSRVWVVDPIDGTRSYADGVPEFSISVALLVDDVPALGFVYNPATEEMFEARAGSGTLLNGRPVHVAPRTTLAGAKIVCSSTENRRRHFADVLPSVELSTIGSLAYKLALVAAGRFDGYISWRRTNDWDIAAAVLLLAESGATLTDAEGMSISLNRPTPQHRGILAAAPDLHRALLGATDSARQKALAGA
ncbi:MAG: 3'(2'),5'-bisphosphate nucleotidase CysQ [Geminicoccaceae bacterium]